MAEDVRGMYERLRLPGRRGRPFFYTNFVQTVDGKVQVLREPRAYWPIGSPSDYRTLQTLRAHADVMIHGRKTAAWVRHVDRLGAPAFQARRARLGKRRPFLYVVLSRRPRAGLARYLAAAPPGVETLLVTGDARIPAALERAATVVRLGGAEVDIVALSRYLHREGYRHGLVEGGPTVLAAFLAADRMDELFVTIAPKIFGNRGTAARTMVEGHLFPPDAVKTLRLVSVGRIADEVYLRYRRGPR